MLGILPEDERYRTCSGCGGDCPPEPAAVEGVGIRLALVCPAHGAQSFIDPFES